MKPPLWTVAIVAVLSCGVLVHPVIAQYFRARIVSSGTGHIDGPEDLPSYGTFNLSTSGVTVGTTLTRAIGNVYVDPTYGDTMWLECNYNVYGTAGYLAQFEIPDPPTSGTATVRQACPDVSDGIGAASVAMDLTTGVIFNGGSGDKILGWMNVNYSGSTSKGFVTALPVGSSTATGAYSPGSITYPRTMGGQYMTIIPSAYRSQFNGYEVLSGMSNASIFGELSQGPCLYALDASQMYAQPAANTVINKTELACWTQGHRRLGLVANASADNVTTDGITIPVVNLTNPLTSQVIASKWWNEVDIMGGIFWPSGTDSIVVVGAKQFGPAGCYGHGGNTNPPNPRVDPLENNYTTGSGAFTTTPGTTIRFPASTNTNAMVGTYFQIDGETTPAYYDTMGGHPGMSLVTGASGSGGATPTITVAQAFNTNISATTYAWSNTLNCYNPDNVGQGPGYQGYPTVRGFVMVFDADDLAAVVAGTKQPYEVVPQTGFFLSLSSVTTSGNLGMSAVYDDAKQLLYLIVTRDSANPIVEVRSVAPQSPAPRPSPLMALSRLLRLERR